ncbi:MAG: hypothetical protein AB1720_11975 [Pseudomonadota bacterium]
MQNNKYFPPLIALGPWALGVAIALITPDDILSRSAMLRGYAEWFANIFPYMSRASSRSAFPEVTLFFHASMWSIAPLWLGMLFMMSSDKIISFKKQMERRWLLLFGYPLFLWLLIFVPHFLMFTSENLTRVETIMSYSRFGLGFSGTAVYAGGWVAYIYVVTIWIRRIPALYFARS